MPIIEYIRLADDMQALAVFSGQSQLVAEATFNFGARANFNCSTSITVNYGITLPSTIDFDGQSSLLALAHLDGEPNYFPEVNCDIEIVTEFVPTHKQIPFINAKFTIDVDATPFHRPFDSYPLEIIVDIIPDAPGQNQQWIYELTIDESTAIKIKSFTYSESKTEVGNSLQIDLANVNDIPVIEAATSFRFRIGMIVGGVTTWHTYINEAIINGSNYSLSRVGNAPMTTYQFTNRSSVADRLVRAPKRDLVIYDPIQVSISQEDFEILSDVDGTEYLTELVPYSGLTLNQIFALIFVEKLGFSAVVSNLPDFPIKRADFPCTDSYLSGVAGLIGMFEPLIFEYQGKLWILDTTAVLPNGFPVSTEITVSNASAISKSTQIDKIDAYLVVYAEDARAFDFYTTRTETIFQENGTASNYTKTEITRTINEYRSFAQPAVIIKSEVKRDRRETSNYFGFTVGRTIEDYTYDYFGRQILSVKSQYGLIPSIPDGIMQLTEFHQERIEIRYAPDPFQPSRQIQQQIWTDIKGLMIVDNDNLQLGAPFKQDYMIAYRSGNLLDSMNTEFGVIQSTRETLIPLSKNQFQLETITHDYIFNTVTKEITEPRNGDFSMSSIVSKQRKVLLPFKSSSLSGQNAVIKKMYLGDMPLNYGLGLAKRLLRRSNLGRVSTSTSFIGTDFYLRRGLPIAVKDTTDTILAKCLVEGYSISGNQRTLMTSIEGLKIG